MIPLQCQLPRSRSSGLGRVERFFSGRSRRISLTADFALALSATQVKKLAEAELAGDFR